MTLSPNLLALRGRYHSEAIRELAMQGVRSEILAEIMLQPDHERSAALDALLDASPAALTALSRAYDERPSPSSCVIDIRAIARALVGTPIVFEGQEAVLQIKDRGEDLHDEVSHVNFVLEPLQQPSGDAVSLREVRFAQGHCRPVCEFDREAVQQGSRLGPSSAAVGSLAHDDSSSVGAAAPESLRADTPTVEAPVGAPGAPSRCADGHPTSGGAS